MSRPYAFPVGPTRLAESSTSMPPPEPRSSTVPRAVVPMVAPPLAPIRVLDPELVPFGATAVHTPLPPNRRPRRLPPGQVRRPALRRGDREADVVPHPLARRPAARQSQVDRRP